MIAHPFVYLGVGAVVVLSWRLKAQSAQVNALGLQGLAHSAGRGGRSTREACGWRIVISPATGHVTLHPVARLARVARVVADFKGIRDG
jgi:hypothetical protein